jgi:gliding-associated putative ABC transporter substrate-binding component GldG
MKNRREVRTFIFLSLAILVVLNILSNRFFLRLDFTSDKRYTLSQATKNILSSLKEPVTVTAYFSEDLPPDIAKTRKDFKELLIEYEQHSKGKIVYKFINPNEKEEKEQEAMRAGIQPVIVNVREKDQMKQQKAYLGAVIQLGERQEAIPFMQPGAAMEYALSSSIKKLSVENKPYIGFLQGHGEPALSSMRDANSNLSVLYQTETFTINDTTPIDSKYKTVAIINPVDSFKQKDFQKLDEFLTRGGNLFIAYSRVKGDLNTAMGTLNKTGLENWLSKKGLIIDDNFLVDADCGTVSVRQQQGPFTFQTNIPFPYFPQIHTFQEHPAVKGIEAVMFQFASAIRFNGDSSVKFTPLAKSSAKTGALPAPLYFDIRKQWTQADFSLGSQTVAAVLSGKISGNTNSKIILVSNGGFAVNGEGERAVQLPPDNVNLLVNCIDWLSDDTGLIDLRTKGVTARPLKQIEDSTKIILKYLNFLLPLLLIVIYGVVRMQMKRNQRVRRMEENYV